MFGFSCKKRDLKVLDLDNAAHLTEPRFDYVVTVDCLHLCENPGSRLSDLSRWLVPGGVLIARIPNLNRIGLQKHRLQQWNSYGWWNRKQIGAHALSSKELRKLAFSAGYEPRAIELEVSERWRKISKLSPTILEEPLAEFIYLSARKK